MITQLLIAHRRHWPVLTVLLGLQLFPFGMLAASAADEQAGKNVKEVFTTLEFNREAVVAAFEEIEKATGFTFSYNRSDVAQKTITGRYTDQSLFSILLDFSRQSGLKFRQYNDVINVKPRRAREKSAEVEIAQVALVVTGTVSDQESNQGLPGVNVLVKNTTLGTVTDVNGEFSINVPNDDDVLVFSSIGYTTQEVAVNGRSTINITLTEDVQSLDEVVVVGYGTVKRKDLTGSVASIEGRDISERNSINVSQALQGTVPGLMVTRNNNAPGSSATMRIRGITTIGNSSPLIILDGVPVDNIDDVNPNDIEDISVLKDAASASIYGSRAAAGVIVVSTKRGKAGETNLEYNFEYGLETPTVMPDYVGPVRYMEVSNEQSWNDNNNDANEFPIYTQDEVTNYPSLNSQNPNLYPITDWQDLIFNDYAPRQSHQLRFTGGTENLSTNVSLSYDQRDAVYDYWQFSRLTGRMNNDIYISDYLSAQVDLYVKRSIADKPVVDPVYRARMSAPIYAAEWTDGRVAGGKQGANIYGQMKYGGFGKETENQVGGRVSLDITPLPDLKITGVVSPQLNYDKDKTFRKQIPYYAWDDPTVFEGYLEGAQSTRLFEDRDDSYRITYQLLANYSKTLGNHSFNVMAGYENYYAFNEALGASRDQYGLHTFPYLNIGPLEYRDNAGSAWENAYRSYFGRLIYNFDDRYLLQANIRYDASSRFAEDYRWGSFPSFSAGWVISEESFMQDIDLLSNLKLRGSWGTLGNERIGNYPYQATMGFSNALFYQGNTVVSAQTAAQWQYAIEDISWETTESFNVGLDASLFDYRLNLTADVYRKTTKDMLLPLEIPDYIGFDNPDQNTGDMITNGWELQVGWNDNVGEWSYSASVNVSDFRSVMGDLGGTVFLGDAIKREGSEFDEWYGYKSAGIYQSADEVEGTPVLNSNVSAGDIRYQDISGPEGVPDGVISPEYDRVLLGGSLPRFMFGGNFRVAYRGFDLSLVLQGVGKQNARLSSNMIRPLMEAWGNVPELIEGNYWSQYNTEQENRSAEFPRISRISESNNYAMSDHWLFDGSYLRLKNITLGYNLPRAISERIKIRNLRVYGAITDLFSIDNYPKGWDPEVDASSYPITTTFILGTAIKF